ncbi:MAG: hypothetical protein RXR06_11780 [Thermoproteus sp.]
MESLYWIVAGVYHIPEHLGVYFSDGEIYVTNVLARERAVYVEHSAEEALAERLSQRQLVVVKGPKGEGKSVLARVALAKKIVYDRAVVVEVRSDWRDYMDYMNWLIGVVDRIREAGREPVLYFDPSQPGHYPLKPWEETWYMPSSVMKLKLLEIVKHVVRKKEATAVAVLSDDMYALAGDRLGGHVAVEVHSDDIIFLQRLVESYGGCPAEATAEVAKELVKYGDNRALMAALAGDWLRGHGCQREAAAEALRRAEGKAVEFALDYIWYAVLGNDRVKANIHAPLIVLRGMMGPVSPEFVKEVFTNLGKCEYTDDDVVKWFTMKHSDTLEKGMRIAAKQTLERKRFEPEELYEALLYGAEDLRKRNIFDGQRR